MKELNKIWDKQFSTTKARCFLPCILTFLHSFPQPNNILLMTEHAYPEIKIIDFGLARQIKDGEQICLIVGTPEYVGKVYLYFLITVHYNTVPSNFRFCFCFFAFSKLLKYLNLSLWENQVIFGKYNLYIFLHLDFDFVMLMLLEITSSPNTSLITISFIRYKAHNDKSRPSLNMFSLNSELQIIPYCERFL